MASSNNRKFSPQKPLRKNRVYILLNVICSIYTSLKWGWNRGEILNGRNDRGETMAGWGGGGG